MISGAIAALIPWDALGWLAAGLAALVALVIGANRRATLRAENKALRATDKQHEAMNDADLGLGASDVERVQRLRDYAAKHGG